MKFAFSISSLLAYASSIVLLGFSIPIIAPILASDNPDDACKSLKPPQLTSATDFIQMGHFQEDCEQDSQAAVSSFTQAVKLNPKAEEPYYHRGNAYAKLENYNAAVADFTEIINRNNTNRLSLTNAAYFQRSRAYAKLGEKQKAISDVTRSMGNSPNADDYLFRGNLYRDLGNKESAVSDYKAADRILQESLNGVFATGLMDSRYEEMLTKVRNELSQLGVFLPAPQLITRQTLQAIAKMEVDRALNLARYSTQHPSIVKFDAQLQDLYKQLANSQPQPDKTVADNLILNAAYEKMEGLEKERSELIKRVTSDHPAVGVIDEQKKQLALLIDVHGKKFEALLRLKN
jgi:tetratricopeptide (TPR) repeat protein